MHVEPPRAPHSAREFLREYGMIVLSVLTALALERVAVAWSNRNDAAASRVRIETELRRDLADLRHSEAENRKGMAVVQKVLSPLLKTLVAGDAPAPKLDPKEMFSISISMPSWQHSAWDTAIADRSAEHIAFPVLSKFAAAYTAAQDLNQISTLVLSGGWFDQGAALTVDIQSGRADLRAVSQFMMRYLIAVQQVQMTEQNLEKKTEIALGQNSGGNAGD